MIFLDTDHLSILTNSKAREHTRLVQRLDASGDDIAFPIVAVEEQFRGWLAQIRRERDIYDQIFPYERFAGLIQIIEGCTIINISPAAADRFNDFRKQKIRIGLQDLKITAIALTHDAVLLSANLRDFKQVPGLRIENWLTE